MFKSPISPLVFIWLVFTVQIQSANGDCASDSATFELDPDFSNFVVTATASALADCMDMHQGIADDCDPDYSDAQKLCEDDLDGEWYIAIETITCEDTASLFAIRGSTKVPSCIPRSCVTCIPRSCVVNEMAAKENLIGTAMLPDGCTAEFEFDYTYFSAGFSLSFINGSLFTYATGMATALLI